MMHSTITDRFQTTIPLDVREALNLQPRQRVSYELRQDGSAIIRPVPPLDELFSSVKLAKPVASIRAEKEAARKAMAREASLKGLK
jgi:bifunctional DNA-binding transcriptional regulator/antitoxin component of YhaV-PrlF toxin-antitoxin module